MTRRNYDSSYSSFDRHEQRDYRSDSKRSCSRRDEEEMYVPDTVVGKIIGRGGAKIRELQDETKCRLNIDRDRSNRNGEVLVRIVGDEHDRRKAVAKIEEIIEESAPKPPPVADSDDGEDVKIDWGRIAVEEKIYEKKRWAGKSEVLKMFYVEAESVASASKESVTDSEQKETEEAPNPVRTFEDAFASYPEVLEQIRKQGFLKPSPIQCQAWPVLLSGRDMIGVAQTGTGKTLAFLLPALIHIEGQSTPRSQRVGPSAIVIAPTRELAIQIDSEVQKYSYRNIKSAVVIGGTARYNQVENLAGVELLIATPGRLCDLVFTERGPNLDITNVTYLVLDEADRMLDMGFEGEIRKVFLNVRPDKQMVMTSATWPQGVRRLASSYMKNPLMVYIGSLDLHACFTVEQKITIVEEDEKEDFLNDFLNERSRTDKTIVFFGRKNTVNHMASNVALRGVPIRVLHSGHSQEDRESALKSFRCGEERILFATDLASRGIDVVDITHVLNFDFPKDIEEYVHRVGRTGRAGRTGCAMTFMTRRDWRHAKELIKILESAEQEVPKGLLEMAERFEKMQDRNQREGGRFGGGRGRGRGWGGGNGHRNSRY
ncbi:unnamed protein product [Notodromas monacha]|uniref:RNA helicase n=1 Tax=Notodromas monacha TaxID=399045 RepID=A0A7R9GBX4_9CRUS|nr:unnamed protein product [Notodromas monacha]CAG0915251.1 unnamed protein product [Notodromas monacha]